MQKRCLGASDIYVSAIGLGTVKWGRNQDVKYPTAFTLPTDKEIEQLLATASQLGINLLDTAPAYGMSEARLGQLLRGQRHDWVISTKVGEEFIAGQSHFDFSIKGIQKSIERSLKRLQTDYLDIVFIHSNGDDARLIQEENVFTALVELKKNGTIRAYGMSTKTLAGGLLAVDLADVAMVTFNCRETKERDVITYAHQKQKGIFIKKAFASGHLQTISQEDPVTESLRFIFAEPGVTSVLIGTINQAHLRENVEKMVGVLS